MIITLFWNATNNVTMISIIIYHGRGIFNMTFYLIYFYWFLISRTLMPDSEILNHVAISTAPKATILVWPFDVPILPGSYSQLPRILRVAWEWRGLQAEKRCSLRHCQQDSCLWAYVETGKRDTPQHYSLAPNYGMYWRGLMKCFSMYYSQLSIDGHCLCANRNPYHTM